MCAGTQPTFSFCSLSCCGERTQAPGASRWRSAHSHTHALQEGFNQLTVGQALTMIFLLKVLLKNRRSEVFRLLKLFLSRA